MSDYITIEIQEEIIKRLPVRSLIRCRSVSKALKGLIDSPRFIATYSTFQTQPQHLLIRYGFTVGVEDQYICFVDDDAFPQQKFAPTVPLSIKQLQPSQMIGSSGGLFCVCGYYPPPDNPGPNRGKRMAVLWNPTIRKSIAIDVPKFEKPHNVPKIEQPYDVLGFGVCPVNSDPKIVKITHLRLGWNMKNKDSMPLKVEVYTLSTGEWRTVPCNLPRQSIRVEWNQVFIDRFIYWLAQEKIAINGRFRTFCRIVSFHMTTDEFRELYLPDSLAHQPYLQMTISKVCESLAVLQYSKDTDKRICDVWMMEYGVPNRFTKLFTIKTPYASITTLRFTKSGKPIMKTQDDYSNFNAETALVVYEPHSDRTNDLGISGISRSFSVNSYMETLLLLNQ